MCGLRLKAEVPQPAGFRYQSDAGLTAGLVLAAVRKRVVMGSDGPAFQQLQQAIDDLARTAQSDLPTSEKLELLCVQIGTAQHWLTLLERDTAGAEGLTGPHFASQPAAPPADTASLRSNQTSYSDSKNATC